MKYNKGFIVIGIGIIIVTAFFLRSAYDPTIETIPTNWGLDGRPSSYSSNSPMWFMTVILVQIMFFGGFVYLNAVFKDGKLLVSVNPPLRLNYLNMASYKDSVKPGYRRILSISIIPLEIVSLLNFTYLGYATLNAFERVNLLSLFILISAAIVLMSSVYIIFNVKSIEKK